MFTHELTVAVHVGAVETARYFIQLNTSDDEPPTRAAFIGEARELFAMEGAGDGKPARFRIIEVQHSAAGTRPGVL